MKCPKCKDKDMTLINVGLKNSYPQYILECAVCKTWTEKTGIKRYYNNNNKD